MALKIWLLLETTPEAKKHESSLAFLKVTPVLRALALTVSMKKLLEDI